MRRLSAREVAKHCEQEKREGSVSSGFHTVASVMSNAINAQKIKNAMLIFRPIMKFTARSYLVMNGNGRTNFGQREVRLS